MENCKIVGAAARYIAYGDMNAFTGNTGEGLIESAVTAGAADQIIIPAQCG